MHAAFCTDCLWPDCSETIHMQMLLKASQVQLKLSECPKERLSWSSFQILIIVNEWIKQLGFKFYQYNSIFTHGLWSKHKWFVKISFQAISKCNYFINFPNYRDEWPKMWETYRHERHTETYVSSLSFQKTTNQDLGHTMDSDDPFLAHTCKRTKKKNGKFLIGTSLPTADQ